MKSAESNIYLDSAFALKLIEVSVAVVLSGSVGLFIVSYPNPLTTTISVWPLRLARWRLLIVQWPLPFDRHHRLSGSGEAACPSCRIPCPGSTSR